MATQAKRLRVPAVRALGVRKRVPPRPSADLRMFRAMSQSSRRITAQEIDELIGTA